MTNRIIPHYNLSTSGNLLQLWTPYEQKSLMDYNLFGMSTFGTSSVGKPIALIDRDGVVIEKAGYHKYHSSPDDMKVIPSVPKAIKMLNNKDIPVVIITNQQGIYKCLFQKNDLYSMDAVIQDALDEEGAHIDSVIFCPHPAKTEGDDIKDYKLCTCRKPKTGMLEASLALYGSDRKKLLCLVMLHLT